MFVRCCLLFPSGTHLSSGVVYEADLIPGSPPRYKVKCDDGEVRMFNRGTVQPLRLAIRQNPANWRYYATDDQSAPMRPGFTGYAYVSGNELVISDPQYFDDPVVAEQHARTNFPHYEVYLDCPISTTPEASQ